MTILYVPIRPARKTSEEDESEEAEE